MSGMIVEAIEHLRSANDPRNNTTERHLMRTMRTKLIYGIMFLLVITGCRTWNGAMIAPQDAPITPRLLTLDRRLDDIAMPGMLSANAGIDPQRLQDEIALFTKEVEQNLVDPYGDKYGTIAFTRNIIDARYGIGNFIASSLLFTVPNLFGMPFMHIRYTISVELRILDRNNKLIGNYGAVGSSSVKVAYYYGYSLRNGLADRKAYTDAVSDAFNKIRPQIQADVARLNAQLLAAGRL
jgi:hypothetical protein